ncbi:MAG: hypothetical protein HYW25_01355 [Candidatus Aenigmarchaeota archaeon]|nr:hypothetical protein [Candidatus Aenigmarchaeota archaeon]
MQARKVLIIGAAVACLALFGRLYPEKEFENAMPAPVELSDGMKIPGEKIRGIVDLKRGKVYVVDPGYGPKSYLRIHDEGDGNPYIFQRVDWQRYENGVLVEDRTEVVQRFDLTYEYSGTRFPIWEPTAFRTHPAYLRFAEQLCETAGNGQNQQ